MSEVAARPPSCAASRRPWMHFSRVGIVTALLGLAAPSLGAQPALPDEVSGETMVLSRQFRHFDGVQIPIVILTAKSVQLATDTLGKWTPFQRGSTSYGFVFQHQDHPGVFVTLIPFAGASPGQSAETWRHYQASVARRLQIEVPPPTADPVEAPRAAPAFASWPTRAAVFTASAQNRLERHIVAGNDNQGIAIILSGTPRELEFVESDFRFLLARMERQ